MNLIEYVIAQGIEVSLVHCIVEAWASHCISSWEDNRCQAGEMTRANPTMGTASPTVLLK